MKKLMMTALAMTIASGAYAACGLPGDSTVHPTVTVTNGLVYKIKMRVETTEAIFLDGYETEGSTGNCGLTGPTGTTCPGVIFRTPTKASWKGYLVACADDCASFDDMYLMLWDSKKKAFIFNEGDPGALESRTSAEQVMKWGNVIGFPSTMTTANGITKPYVFDSSNPYNVIGKKFNRVEANWRIRDVILPQVPGYSSSSVIERGIDIYGAGQGKWSDKIGLPQNISGYFAGWVDAPILFSSEDCGPGQALSCVEASACEPCLSDAITETDTTAIYGKWSIKYSASYSKKIVEAGYGDFISANKIPDNYDNAALRNKNY